MGGGGEEEGPCDRRRWMNEKKKSHPPEGDATTGRQGTAKTPRDLRGFAWRSPGSPTCSPGGPSSSLNDSISLRVCYNPEDRTTT